jgi:hypothetical protein
VLRFTVNGSAGISDLDAEVKLQADTWQHFAAVYNGKDMELYLNSLLNSFRPWTGTIKTTTTTLTLGQMLPDNASYNYDGLIDDLRIFNYGVDQETVSMIYTNELSGINTFEMDDHFILFPNPADKFVNIYINNDLTPADEVKIINLKGQVIWKTNTPETFREGMHIKIPTDNLEPGIFIICLLKQRELRTEKLIIY